MGTSCFTGGAVCAEVRAMFWARHYPIFRRALLGANVLLPLATFAVWAGGLPWCALGVAAVAFSAHGLLMFAVFHPRCPWLGAVMRSFKTELRAVWLTIDDGPSAESAQLAAELEKRGVRATFFIIGEKLNPRAAGGICDAGHRIANHTLTHPKATMWMCRGARLRSELDGGTGEAGCFFRPPVGHKPPGLHPALAVRGWPCIAWTVGGRDGWSAEADVVVERVLAVVAPGAILMLHECRPHSMRTILAVVDAVLARGYEFVIPTRDELREECV